jgi:hypothetical protein
MISGHFEAVIKASALPLPSSLMGMAKLFYTQRMRQRQEANESGDEDISKLSQIRDGFEQLSIARTRGLW